MECILTIIVPAYNAQKYLEKCLNSFLVEPILDSLEVLIVNDGSTDETVKIALEYCDQYPSVFYLVNKENGGHGSVINTVIPLIHGKYMKVVDADDWVVTENLSSLINILKNTEADAVLAPFDMIDQKTGKVKKLRMNCQLNHLYKISVR